MSKKSGLFKGTIFGIVIGAIAGVLLAPKSGKDTQKDIARKVKETAADIQSRLEDMTAEVTGRVDSLKEAAKDLSDEAKAESHDLVKRAEVLKKDLLISATNLAKQGNTTKEATLKDVNKLLNEGTQMMDELERLTKKLMDSAKDKLKDVSQS
jgi:gas vesicle protein